MMSYNNGYGGNRGGGGGAQVPKKYIPLGGMWAADSDKWSAKTSELKIFQEQPWVLDLLMIPSSRIAIYPNDYADNPRSPGFNLTLVIPEQDIPQDSEFWQWEADRQAARQGGGGGYQAPQGRAPYGQGGQRQAPAPVRGNPSPQRGGYNEPLPPRGTGRTAYQAPQREAYPPRQPQTPVRGRGVPQAQPPYEEEDYSDPFSE